MTPGTGETSMMQPMKIKLDPSSGLHIARLTPKVTEKFLNAHAIEMQTGDVPLPQFSNGSAKLANKMLKKPAPSTIPPTKLSKKKYESDPGKSPKTLLDDDVPPKSTRKQSRLFNSEPSKFTEMTLNELVPSQVRGKITTQNAISMGEKAKKILASSTTVSPVHGNVDKAIWASLERGNTIQSSITQPGIEKKPLGYLSKLQSKNLHPLIQEKLQLMALFGNGAACA